MMYCTYSTSSSSKALDPLFLVVPELEHDSSVDITPLMVACDKGNVACL